MIGPPLCPICEQKLAGNSDEHFPFCSKRCREVDLLRWSKGEYAIVKELDPREAEVLKAMEDGDIPPELLG